MVKPRRAVRGLIVAMLIGSAVFVVLVGRVDAAAAPAGASPVVRLGAEETPSTTAEVSSSTAPQPTETDAEGGTGRGSETTSDPLVVGLLVGGLALVVITVLVRTRSPRAQRVSPTKWQSRMAHICDEGREVVDQTAVLEPGQPGSGLSLTQLAVVERRISHLLRDLDEVERGAPSDLAGRAVRIASSHASVLDDAVQTERQLRLSSVDPGDEMLAVTAHNLAAARASLDQSLRDLASVTSTGGRGPKFGQPGFSPSSNRGAL